MSEELREELREELARAIASTSLAHADDAVEPGYPFNRFADAILPIIARVRKEAYWDGVSGVRASYVLG